jgi:hypothetical protein
MEEKIIETPAVAAEALPGQDGAKGAEEEGRLYFGVSVFRCFGRREKGSVATHRCFLAALTDLPKH